MKNINIYRIITAVFIIFCFAMSMQAQIYISEVMYNPPTCHGDDADCEYIVITNGNATVANIGGYIIENAFNYSIPGGTSIPAGGSITIGSGTCPGYTFDLSGGWSGSLSDAGGTVALSLIPNFVLASVTYSNADGANGDGDSQFFDGTQNFDSAGCPSALTMDATVTAVCNGDDVDVTITWAGTDLGGITANVNGNGVQSGTSPLIYTIAGPTSAMVGVNVVITDDCHDMCSITETVDLPACPGASCPVLTAVAPVAVISSESTCMNACTLGGGVIAIPATNCPTNSTLQYSINNTTWSTTLPTYDQENSVTVYTRCLCDVDMTTVSPTSDVVTVPGTCSALTPPSAANVAESTCTSGCEPSGGSITAPTTGCGTGTTLQYSIDNSSWSTSIPAYSLTAPVTVYTRCICTADNTVVSTTAMVTTVPATCAFTPPSAANITESTCPSGCLPSGGEITAPTTGCGAGFTLFYSLDNISWSANIPAYDQIDPITVYTSCRCNSDFTMGSTSASVTTVPGTCGALTPPSAANITESTCTTGCEPTDGVVAAPTTLCGAGTTLEYSTNNTTWSTTIPTYNQTTAITVYTRCNCDADNSNSSTVASVLTVPATCPALTPPSAANITESTCTTGCTPSGGVVAAPTTTCGAGTTLQYSINNTTWSSSIPTYDQDAAITVYTRCNCNTDNTISSTAVSVTTVPGTCSITAPSAANITESTCPTGCVASGGEVTAPTTLCGSGFSLQYSTDNIAWSATVPTYDQSNAITVYTRCNCDSDNSISSTAASVTTVPATCGALTPPSAANITESTCPSGCEAIGGLVEAPTTLCGAGSTLQYSTDNVSWSATVPTYNPTTAITVYTRCNCDADNSVSSTAASVTTVPATCGALTAPSAANITESTCPSGCEAVGGLVAAPTTLCGTGSTLQYSTDNAMWSTTIPTYNPTTAITVYTRCNCDADNTVSSTVASVTTVPATCGALVPPSAANITESTCTTGCEPIGGLVEAPTTLCGTGSTLQYSTDNAMWSTTIPTYNPTTAITVYTRCNCDSDNTVSSTTASVTTVPATCGALVPPSAANITESTCATGCEPIGGLVEAPTTLCGTGSTLQYSTDNAMWSTTIPTYNLTTAITVYTRCNCDSDNTVSSTAASVTTVPATCGALTPPSAANITESTCPSGCEPMGGSVAAPTTLCGSGSTLQYSLDNAMWSTTLPTYDQENAITVYTRCNCDTDNSVSSTTTSVTTVPASCTIGAPSAANITESSCMANCTLGGGAVTAPTTGCATGFTLQYSTDNLNWSATVSTYDQENAITVYTRCNCDSDNTISSTSASVLTVPGTCTLPAAPAGMTITNSSCIASVETGGSFNGFGAACTTGTLTFYSDPAGLMGATTTAPTYAQAGPAQTIYMRCVDALSCESPVTTLGPTSPSTCIPATVDNNASADDPCSCNGDGSTFSETVTVTSGNVPGTGETWTITVVNAPGGGAAPSINVGDVMTDNNDGTYSITFNHTDLQGYDITMSDGVQNISISNVCTYPTISLEPIAVQCNAPVAGDPVTLVVDQTNSSWFGMGAFNLSGTGVVGNTFDPDGVAHGSYTVTATFTPVNGSGDNGTLAIPATAINGSDCPVTVTQAVDVIDCSPQTSCACLPNPNTPLSLLGQHASGAGDGFVTVYVLVDASGQVLDANMTGAFTGLPDVDALGNVIVYTMHPINVATADAATVLGLFPAGTVFSSVDITAYCAGACTSAEFSNDCDCPIPSIAVDKDDNDDTDDNQEVILGNDATFTITITNDGTEDLCDISIQDAEGPLCVLTAAQIATEVAAVGNMDAIFNPGESFSYTCTVPMITEGPFRNTIIASAVGCATSIGVAAADQSEVEVVPCPAIIVEAVPTCASSTSDDEYHIVVNSVTGGDPTTTMFTFNDGTTNYTVDGSAVPVTIGPFTYVNQNSKVSFTVSDNDNAANCIVEYDVLQLSCAPQMTCDCSGFPTTGPLDLLAQAAGNGNGFSMFYVLVNGLTSNVDAVNTTGIFNDLMDKNYADAACPEIDWTVYAVNVKDDELVAAQASIVTGAAFDQTSLEDDYCVSVCSHVFNDDCGCKVCPAITTATVSEDEVCEGGLVDLSFSGFTNFAKTANGEKDYGLTIVEFNQEVIRDPYVGGTVLQSVAALPTGTINIYNVERTPGTYLVCAILDDTPPDVDNDPDTDDCRPAACVSFTVLENPTVAPTASSDVCWHATDNEPNGMVVIEGNAISNSGSNTIAQHLWTITDDDGLGLTDAANLSLDPVTGNVTVNVTTLNPTLQFGKHQITISYTVIDSNGCASDPQEAVVNILIPQCGDLPWDGND